MDAYNLYAKLCLDSSEYEKGMKDAKSSAGGLTGLFGKVGSVASTVGKGIFNVAAKVATVSVAAATAGEAAVSALTTLAVNSYANYEQLVGGVETLYKDSAAKVQQYAADAYKTSGMTAGWAFGKRVHEHGDYLCSRACVQSGRRYRTGGRACQYCHW